MKELKININAERIRNNLYELIKQLCEYEYSFRSEYEYKWFEKNVIKENENITILKYSFDNVVIDYIDKQIFHVIYAEGDHVDMTDIVLVRQNRSLHLPNFKKGEK